MLFITNKHGTLLVASKKIQLKSFSHLANLEVGWLCGLVLSQWTQHFFIFHPAPSLVTSDYSSSSDRSLTLMSRGKKSGPLSLCFCGRAKKPIQKQPPHCPILHRLPFKSHWSEQGHKENKSTMTGLDDLGVTPGVWCWSTWPCG